MRKLRILLVYLLSMGLFLCVIPLLNIGVGRSLDSIMGLREVGVGSAALILAAQGIWFGLIWVAWSLHCLVAVGKAHPQQAIGWSLVPGTASLVINLLFAHTRHAMGSGYLFALASAGLAWRSVAASLMIPLIGGLLFTCYLKLLKERGLERRFGKEYVWCRQHVPLPIPGFSRTGVRYQNHEERSMNANGSSGR